MKIGNRIVSNGMVIQQGEEWILSGTGIEGEEILASFAGMERKTVCRENSYTVTFDSLAPGGPYELVVSANGETTTVGDILVGDVYFMSGQSNMELDVNWIYYSFAKEIDDFECDVIRQFKVPVDYDFDQVQPDVADGKWVKAQGEAKKSFGAIGFFMAKKLYEKQHYPIGLIQTAVPGCPIESFLSRENVSMFQTIQLPQICHSKMEMKEKIQQELLQWQQRIDQMMEEDKKLSVPEYQEIIIPVLLDNKKNQAGIYTFRKVIELPRQPEEDAVLKLGLLIEMDYTYVNGTLVGRTDYQYPPRRYTIPKALLHEGENEIIVKLITTNGVGRFWEKQSYELRADGITYHLSGVWQYYQGAFSTEALIQKTFFEYLPYGVYNAMIAPLMDYRVRGILWYQGESNTANPERYCDKMKVLIEQFRSQMKQKDLPFYYVQIADYEDPADPEGKGWRAIREEQRKAQNIHHTYMIISRDVGSATDLHPQNKKAIGERIAERIEHSF